MKQSLKRWLRQAGIAVVNAKHHGIRYVDQVPCNALESVLLRLFPNLHGLVFLQVGANDGQRFDPINHLVLRYQWCGILVEPVPALFRALESNYQGNPRLQLVQAAVDIQAGRRPIFHLREAISASVPDWAWGLATFEREQLKNAVSKLGLSEESIISTDVLTVPWSELWSRLRDKRCDLLVLDTEGYDLTLLRGAGLAARRPRVVHFEHVLVSLEDRLDFYRELVDMGYEIATDGPDTTAWLRE